MERFDSWRFVRRSLASLSLLLLLGGVASAQGISPFFQKVDLAYLLSDRCQYYEFLYDAQGTSIWGPGVPGTQTLDFSLPLVSPKWEENLGVFFNPCLLFDCTFGAGIRTGVSAQTAAVFHGRADLGSVDLHVPGGVGINYPKDEDIVPLQLFTITTFCVVEPSSYMNINPAHLSLKVDGHIDAQLDLALVAEAFGDDLVNVNLFKLIGLPSPSISGDHELIDTGNLVGPQDFPLPIPPNIGSGAFHVPNLAARGNLRKSGLIRARAADNFLTLNADLTNMLVQYAAFGLPIPLNDSFDFGGFNFEYHIIDLNLSAAAGIQQDFAFDPRPLIEFRTNRGEVKTIHAGESVQFRAPGINGGDLVITPTIIYDQNTFSDATAVTVDPVLTFDLIHVKGGGEIAGHDLFHFNVDPFGIQRVDFGFDVPLFDQTFALPSPGRQVCPPFTLTGPVKKRNQFDKEERNVIDPGDGSASFLVSIHGDDDVNDYNLHIQGANGALDQKVTIDPDGFATVTINDVRDLGEFHPITVSGEYLTPGKVQFPVEMNAVTYYWFRPPLARSVFDPVIFDPQQLPGGQLVTYKGTGKFKIPLHSNNVEEGATLLYDDLPIPTTVDPSPNVPDGVLVTGEIPPHVLDRGGNHTLSFLNAGLNQDAILLQNLTVNYAAPTISLLYRPATPTTGTTNLLVRGTGFTVDTKVTIDGQARAVNFVAPTELRVPLVGHDNAAGAHRVAVSNPAPGGGTANGLYKVDGVPADVPVLTAKHGLMRHQSPAGKPDDDVVADQITLINAGKNTLRDVTVTGVTLTVRNKTYAATGLPQKLPVLHPGEYSSVQALLPPHTSLPGDTGVLQVRGTVHKKAFVLSNRVTLPAYLPMD